MSVNVCVEPSVSCVGLIKEQKWKQERLLGLIFAGYMPLASQSPYLIIIYSVANYRRHLSHFWANIKFSQSQLSLFLFIYLPSIA